MDDASGSALFRRVHLATIGGRWVAVTGVIGVQAFNAVPFADRAGHRVTDPVRALRELMLAHHHEVDSWVLLSHSGFAEDLKTAEACPFLDVIFAGHCHSDQYGPVRVGDTLLLKGHELAVGYALAEGDAEEGGWSGRPVLLPPAAAASQPGLEPIHDEIESLRRRLAAPIGPVARAYRHRVPDRSELVAEIVERLRTDLGAEAVVLNETALRPVPLGTTLTRGDLLATEPFDNQLVHVTLPDDQHQVDALLERLSAQAGPLVTAPAPLPPCTRSLLTTGYLADAYFGGHPKQAAVPLGRAVQHVLTEGGSP